MEYVVGPIIGLLLGMKFTVWKAKQYEDKFTDLQAKVESVVVRVDESEKEMPKRVMATVAPVAIAVKKLNEQVGIS